MKYSTNFSRKQMDSQLFRTIPFPYSTFHQFYPVWRGSKESQRHSLFIKTDSTSFCIKARNGSWSVLAKVACNQKVCGMTTKLVVTVLLVFFLFHLFWICRPTHELRVLRFLICWVTVFPSHDRFGHYCIILYVQEYCSHQGGGCDLRNLRNI